MVQALPNAMFPVATIILQKVVIQTAVFLTQIHAKIVIAILIEMLCIVCPVYTAPQAKIVQVTNAIYVAIMHMKNMGAIITVLTALTL